MLTLENLAVSINERKIIHSLGLTVFNASCLVINGKNGIGKTLLLETLAGLRSYSDGTIKFNNLDAKEEAIQYQSGLFYLGHSNALKEELTVFDNLQFIAKLYKSELALLAAANVFNIQNYFDYKVSSLSQGWKRRVALTKLMLVNAKLWLLDEPFANIDDDGKERLTALIKSRCENGGIVVVTSHYPIKEENYCNIDLSDYIITN
jgi:heme exporter protein A